MEPGQPQNRADAGRRKTVLVVDDQPDVADTGAEILTLSGYDARVAYSAAEALEMLGRGDPVDALFADISMRGGMSGIDLALVCRDRFPGVAMLLTTGHGDALADAKAKGFETVAKPYSVASLRTAIARLCSLGD